MSPTASLLIGQILNPGPARPSVAAAGGSVARSAHALLAQVVNPGPRVGPVALDRAA